MSAVLDEASSSNPLTEIVLAPRWWRASSTSKGFGDLAEHLREHGLMAVKASVEVEDAWVDLPPPVG